MVKQSEHYGCPHECEVCSENVRAVLGSPSHGETDRERHERLTPLLGNLLEPHEQAILCRLRDDALRAGRSMPTTRTAENFNVLDKLVSLLTGLT